MIQWFQRYPKTCSYTHFKYARPCSLNRLYNISMLIFFEITQFILALFEIITFHLNYLLLNGPFLSKTLHRIPKGCEVFQSNLPYIHLCSLVNLANTSTIPSDCSQSHWSVVILMCGLWARRHPLWLDKKWIHLTVELLMVKLPCSLTMDQISIVFIQLCRQ